jgi:hypothetical protein
MADPSTIPRQRWRTPMGRTYGSFFELTQQNCNSTGKNLGSYDGCTLANQTLLVSA